MKDGRCPGSIEGWLGDLEQRPGLAEVLVLAGIDKRVVSRHARLKIFGWHRYALVFHHDLPREFADSFRAEEEAAIDIDVRRLRVPVLASHRAGIEDSPDRPATIVPVADAGERGIKIVVRFELNVLSV